MTQDGSGRPRRIYIAGPLSADTEEEMIANSEIAQHVAYELIKKGYVPFIPHLSVYTSFRDKVDYEWWMKYCFAWLEQCDALFFIGESPGANREIARADEIGLRLFYKLDDVPDMRGGTDVG